MDLIWFLVHGIMCFFGGYLLCHWQRNRSTKVGTPSASHNAQRSANFLPRYADEDDNPFDYNDAYNFHADCGDR